MMTLRTLFAAFGLAASLLTPMARADDDPALRDEVRRLREDVRQLQQEMRDLRQTAGAPRRTATGWEVVDGLVLHPEDSPRLGAANARIALIEFSDYQCPYCARHFTDTMPQIEREFVATGKLMVVASEFPLERMHPLALKAAQAARCAADQGKFWQMHARLFQNQRRLEPWSAHAEALKLDAPRFDACMAEAKGTEDIRRNVQEAVKAGVNSTPTFLLALNTPDGLKVVRRVRGAAPFAAFKAEIEALLQAE